MNKEENNFNGVTLDDLASMVATGFSRLENRIDALENRIDALENRIDALENRIDALEKEFIKLRRDFNEHIKNVGMQTDASTHSIKKLEETVYGIGNYPV